MSNLELSKAQSLSSFVMMAATLTDEPLTKSAAYTIEGKRIHLWKMGSKTLLALTQGKKFLGVKKTNFCFETLKQRIKLKNIIKKNNNYRFTFFLNKLFWRSCN